MQRTPVGAADHDVRSHEIRPASYSFFRRVIVLLALLQAATSALSQDVRDQYARSFGERQGSYASMVFALSRLLSRMTPKTQSHEGEIWLIFFKFMKSHQNSSLLSGIFRTNPAES